MTTAKTKPKPKGLDRPSTVRIIKAMSVAHTWLYRHTGGRLGKKWHVGSALRNGVPVCLLTTTGRKSGQPRTVPLLHMADGENVILVASQGGLPTNPAWYHNLRANPDVTVQLGRTTRRMRARTADAAERARLWPRLLEVYADYASYQTWTDREIPVVICEPVA
ncbi:MAG TPA: nitroreductase family deazaflavin-dependent oxidoreductase [Jatrophihabitantaceae bacterium]|nr:nitroreductase family deazaflavin-dependent oxidoreductase [Jatrophihabitantaceae bacterium]